SSAAGRVRRATRSDRRQVRLSCRQTSAFAFSGLRQGSFRGMPVRVGINGFGRIGRNVFRAAYEKGADIEWVAANDITDPKTTAHLLKYDSNYGPFPGQVEATDTGLRVDGKELRIFAE